MAECEKIGRYKINGLNFMEIKLANVKYSENLGDGLLCECMEYAIQNSFCPIDSCDSIDLAARMQYSEPHLHRGALLSLLSLFPAWARDLSLIGPLCFMNVLKWRPHYNKQLKSCDMLVVGGGNLFIDIDLNFPVKLSSIIGLANRRNIPIAIYGVGVGNNWSRIGRWLISRALKKANIAYLSVRDEASKVSFLGNFGHLLNTDIEVVLDPGFLASRIYRVPDRILDEQKVVGINICSAAAIRYHSQVKVSDVELIEWYSQLIVRLASSGYSVKVFTNGGGDDELFKTRILSSIAQDNHAIEDVERADSPQALVETISSLRLVVAFRMHALIAGLSLGENIIALKWDVKVDSMMERLGLAENIFSVLEVAPDVVATRVDALMNVKGNVLSSENLANKAEDDIDPLVNKICKISKFIAKRVEPK